MRSRGSKRRYRARWWWAALAIGIVGLVTVEALRAPLKLVRFNGIASVHHRLDSDSVTGIVVFPLYGGVQFNGNARYLLDQTRHWRPMINGYSSFAPESFFQRAARLQSFPAAAAIQELRSIHVSHVVLHRAPLEAAFGAQAHRVAARPPRPRARRRAGRRDHLPDSLTRPLRAPAREAKFSVSSQAVQNLPHGLLGGAAAGNRSEPPFGFADRLVALREAEANQRRAVARLEVEAASGNRRHADVLHQVACANVTSSGKPNAGDVGHHVVGADGG